MNIFVNANRELRSGWKFATFLFIFFAVLFGCAALISSLFDVAPADELILLTLNAGIILIPTSAALLIMARFVDHRPIRTYGVGFYERWRRDLLWGLAIAGIMLGVLMAGCVAFGDIDIRWTAGMASPGRLILTVALLAVAAANEELLFRGYPLQALIHGIGVWPATILMSLIFGMTHLSNPNASLLSVGNTVLAGVMLSLAYVQTRWLWLPYGIHIGWNAGQGWVLGFPLSGLDISSLWTTNVSGDHLILGGAYGPEAGLLGTFIFFGAAVMVKRGFLK
ncbi:MAG: CPBP family intramembrane metalloprotease [Acidobacteria bacterium]|nr:CPBP family intramembrane metalloprotease [Acidobacteriota bacterium]